MKNLLLDVLITLNGETYKVGTLAHAAQQIYFEYSSTFITQGIELSPFKLPLKAGAQIDKDRTFAGLPGVINDSLPDGWGLLLMDRYFREQGLDPAKASPLERLAFIGDRAMGALSYQPATTANLQWDRRLNLEQLAQDCADVLQGHDHDILPELLIAGGSPGGARPKVLIGYHAGKNQLEAGVSTLSPGFEHYLVKFPTLLNLNDSAELEFCYANMARACGIEVPETKLFNTGRFGLAFGVKRFDRVLNQKIHTHTLSGLLHADFRMPNLDYLDFLKATYLLTQNFEHVKQAYRRMIFNVLFHNRDDHTKNFSYLYQHNQWQLAPAYDLTFSEGLAGEHTMTVAGHGTNITAADCLQVAHDLNIPKKTAKNIIEEIATVRANWLCYAKDVGLEKPIRNRLTKIFKHLAL